MFGGEPPAADTSLSLAKSRPRSVLVTLAAVFGVTALSKVLGFLSQILVTSLVGTTGAADTYYFAFSIVNMVSALGIGAAGFVLIPLYVEKKEREGMAQANAFANAVLTYSFIALAALSLLMALLAGPLVTSFGRFPVALRFLAVRIFAATAPLALLVGAGQLLMALSQARRRFVAPAFMGVQHSLVFMGVLVAGWKELRVYALVLATAVSLLLQVIVMVWRLRGSGRLAISLRLPQKELLQILLLAWPLLFSQILSTIQVFASRSIASGLLIGSVAALTYAEALKAVFLDLCVVPLAQISLPHFSETIARGNRDAAWRQLQEALTALWFVVTPVVVLLWVLSSPLIRLFYQRGAFTAQSTALTASALAFFSIGLVGEAPHYLVCRYYFALRDTSTPTQVSIPFTVLYVALLYPLSKFLGLRGIALGHSLVMIGNMTAALLTLREKVHLRFEGHFRRSLTGIAFSGVAMLAFSQLAFSWLSAALAKSVLFSFVEITVVSVAGIALYLACASLTGATRSVAAVSRLMPTNLLAEMRRLWMPQRVL